MLPAGGNPIYYAEDLLGSSRVITQNNGAVCYDADFDPYGGEHPYTNNCPSSNAYKFEGKERDAETGNDDFGARYYTSRFGRWLSADWSSVPVPVPYANLTNPQTLNLYSMVSDDPESFADLDGHAGQSASQGLGDAQSANNQRVVCNQNGDGGSGCDEKKLDDDSVLVLKVEAGAEIGAEAKFGPVHTGLSASAGVEADATKPSLEGSVKVDADISAGRAKIGGEAKLSVATLDKDGLHADLRPTASIGLGGENEKKTFGIESKHDTSDGFIVSGTLKAGVVKVEIGVNFTALKNKILQTMDAAKRFSSLDFSGPIPQYSPRAPNIQ